MKILLKLLLSQKSGIVNFIYVYNDKSMWILYLHYLLLYIKGNIIYKEFLPLNEDINTKYSHNYLHKETIYVYCICIFVCVRV